MLLYISVKQKYLFRGVAQLVARVVWDHEVAGSIPVTSTIKNRVVKDKTNLTTLFLISYFIAKPFSSASSEKTPLLKSTLKTSISSIETLEQPYLLRISSFIS